MGHLPFSKTKKKNKKKNKPSNLFKALLPSQRWSQLPFLCLSFQRYPRHLKPYSCLRSFAALFCSWALLVDSLEIWFLSNQLSGQGVWGSSSEWDLGRLSESLLLSGNIKNDYSNVCPVALSVGKSKPGCVSWGRYVGNSVGLQPSQSPSHIKG